MTDGSLGSDLVVPCIEREPLRARIREMGAVLSERYRDEPEPPVLVGVLKGCAYFMADLFRAMSIDAAVDFMAISSYAGGGASGVVRIVKDLDQSVAGRDVLIVEDIVDTGLTLNYLRRTLGERKPRSLEAVTLLDKAVRRIVPVPLEHVCFEIPDLFVVGYGLDFQGLYRNVPDILSVTDIARLAAEPRLLVASLWPDSIALDG